MGGRVRSAAPGRARPPGRVRRRARRNGRNPPAYRGQGGRRRVRPRPIRSPMASRDRPAWPRGCCCGLSCPCTRSGESAAGKPRRNPSRQWRRAVAPPSAGFPRSAPCGPSGRSAPLRTAGRTRTRRRRAARSLCTATGNFFDRVRCSRSGQPSTIAMTSASEAAASLSAGGMAGSRSRAATAASTARPGSRTRRAARSKSSAPSASISSTSWPRGILMPASWYQCANGSPHASM